MSSEKVGSLSLFLQKYEENPKYFKDVINKDDLLKTPQKLSELNEPSEIVMSQQIKVPSKIRVQERNQIGHPNISQQESMIKSSSPKKVKESDIRDKMNISHLEESPYKAKDFEQVAQIKIESGKKEFKSQLQEAEEEMDEEELQIIQMCGQLTNKVTDLKRKKYDHAIHEFEQQQRKQKQFLMDKQAKRISKKYEEKGQQLTQMYKNEQKKLMKTLEDIVKYKKAYQMIIEELEQRKATINKEYDEANNKCRQHKQKMISQWKRGCNQEIKKISK